LERLAIRYQAQHRRQFSVALKIANTAKSLKCSS
jgi:hypothetical protein